VQSCHACIESTKSFPNPEEHPHLVVIGIPNEAKLYKAAQRLDQSGIRYKIFFESDRNDEATAMATEVVHGEARRLFKNYQLLKEKENGTLYQIPIQHTQNS